ncbi:hypothetical protein HDU86_007585 [Geranomyces michiganensis]|nr:hypothetical protein HDU86_007585 [Geranomyces michiganensis]
MSTRRDRRSRRVSQHASSPEDSPGVASPAERQSWAASPKAASPSAASPSAASTSADRVLDLDTDVTPTSSRPNHVLGEEQIQYIAAALRTQIGSEVTSAIVTEATANLGEYARSLKDYMRGYKTVVDRLFSIRTSISRGQAGCLIQEAVPYLQAKYKNNDTLWRPFILVHGCESRSNKIAYIREYMVLCQFTSNSPQALTGKIAYLYAREARMAMTLVYTGVRWKNNGKEKARKALGALQKLETVLAATDFGTCFQAVKNFVFKLDVTHAVCPEGKRDSRDTFSPSHTKLAAVSLEIVHSQRALSPADKLCLFALTSQCKANYLQHVPRYPKAHSNVTVQRRQEYALCVHVPLPHNLNMPNKHYKELLFGISAPDLASVTYTLRAFHSDGNKPKEKEETEKATQMEPTGITLSDKEKRARFAEDVQLEEDEMQLEEHARFAEQAPLEGDALQHALLEEAIEEDEMLLEEEKLAEHALHDALEEDKMLLEEHAGFAEDSLLEEDGLGEHALLEEDGR